MITSYNGAGTAHAIENRNPRKSASSWPGLRISDLVRSLDISEGVSETLLATLVAAGSLGNQTKD